MTVSGENIPVEFTPDVLTNTTADRADSGSAAKNATVFRD